MRKFVAWVFSLRAADVGRTGISIRKFMVLKLNLNAELFY